MSISEVFIRRPIGTTLLAIGLFLVGLVAWLDLPVSSMPNVELPTIRIFASLPGADPSTMASTVAAPIERRLGEIAGVTEMTSSSSFGSTRITVQFALDRKIEGAARDVQAALNGAVSDLPGDMPQLPRFRKMNPNAAPVLILAMTSDTVPASEIFDAADTVVAQRIMQVSGVADVSVGGSEQPAIRVRVNPLRLAAMGLSVDTVRATITAANANAPVGIMHGPNQAVAVAVNDQLKTLEDYRELVIRTPSGNPVRLGDVATVERGTRNSRSLATFNGKPAVLLQIRKDAQANVVDTVDQVKALLPEIRRWIPADVEISILADRTGTLRASIAEMQFTLALALALVMVVVFAFLRRLAPTLAAGVTLPLSLAGTIAAMWLVGFTIDNLTLMALLVAVGFVVDDAIVMIENVFRNLEDGKPPLEAAIVGARQIGFTIVSISISLIAAFIPLLFMDGVIGRVLRVFSLTLVFAIIVSTVVSLTVTAMICAHFVKRPPSRDATWLDRRVEGAMSVLVRGYARTLAVTLRHNGLMLLTVLLCLAVTVLIYVKIPKGFLPSDDTGLLFAWTSASPDISFQAMSELQKVASDIVMADPAVESVGSTVGGGIFSGTVNNGRMFIALKSRTERGGLTTGQVVQRLRRGLTGIRGLEVWVNPSRDIRVGGRESNSDYQWTLWSQDVDLLYQWVPKVEAELRRVPGIVGVSSDRQPGGLQANVVIDRIAAARLGVTIQSVNTALNNAYSQRQISTIYGQRNQYRVVLEVEPQFQRDPNDLQNIHVPGRGGVQVPLSAVTRVERSTLPLSVNHEGQFPAVTISYSVPPGVPLEVAEQRIAGAIAQLRLPDAIRINPAGDLKAFKGSAASQPLLILTALLAVYIVLGVLYESLAHPLTIISTLPSAGLGALITIWLVGMELSVLALIGIILLIGIVKKNGIMLVDFALEAERKRGLAAEQAIHEACIARFRPILMTTLAAMLGALPLLLGSGPGSELRRPLGVAIIGGLAISQILTIYTTPAIYILLDRLHRRISGGRRPRAAAAAPSPHPAE